MSGRRSSRAPERPRRSLSQRAGNHGGSEPSWDDRFREISDQLTDALGTPWALLTSVLLIVVWALTGPLFRFSDTWQLVINTATTIITFWMVFVIQTSQNRQSKAVQFKLDELIRSIPGARNRMIEAERATAEELRQEEEAFRRTAEQGESADAPPGDHPAGQDVHDGR
ncbi:MAG: low affinity iron permease family protein [Chloroflexota bacterium]|nr:low affinity iron permease family protein [Chloroflexota bacterium]